MTGRRSSGPAPWRWWALRASLIFGFVYAIGVLGVPTLVPYLAAVILVVIDAVGVAKSKAGRPG